MDLIILHDELHEEFKRSFRAIGYDSFHRFQMDFNPTRVWVFDAEYRLGWFDLVQDEMAIERCLTAESYTIIAGAYQEYLDATATRRAKA